MHAGNVVNEALRNTRPNTEVITGSVNIIVSDYDKLEAAYPETQRIGFWQTQTLSPKAITAIIGYVAYKYGGKTHVR